MWQGRSNPLAWWWGFLTLVSGANIAAWFVLCREFQRSPRRRSRDPPANRCCCFAPAMSSAAPSDRCCRAPMSSASACSTLAVERDDRRSVATVAELCFAAQWALILHQLGAMTGADTTLNVAWLIVPLIVIAECFSWYAV